MMVFQKWNRNGLPFKAKLQCIGLHLRHICLTSIVLQRPRVEFGQGNIRRHQETGVQLAQSMPPNLDVMVAPRIGWDSCCDLLEMLWSVEPFCRIGHWNTLEHTGTAGSIGSVDFPDCTATPSVQQNPKLDPTCPGKIDNHIHSQAIKTNHTNQSNLSPLFANDVTQLLLYVVISWFSCHYVLVLSTTPLGRWNHGGKLERSAALDKRRRFLKAVRLELHQNWLASIPKLMDECVLK